MESLVAVITAPSSGPFWGLVGIMVTQVANIILARKKNANEIAATHLTAINDASKNLIEQLFQTMRNQGEQIERLQSHTEECEKQHRDAQDQIIVLQRQISLLQKVTGTPEGAE